MAKQVLNTSRRRTLATRSEGGWSSRATVESRMGVVRGQAEARAGARGPHALWGPRAGDLPVPTFGNSRSSFIQVFFRRPTTRSCCSKSPSTEPLHSNVTTYFTAMRTSRIHESPSVGVQLGKTTPPRASSSDSTSHLFSSQKPINRRTQEQSEARMILGLFTA